MSTLKSSRSKLGLNDSTSRSNTVLEKAGGPISSTSLSRHNSGLFSDLNSIRNDIRKQINSKFQQETGLLKQETKKASPLKAKETRTGLFANRAEQASIIHADLLNAVKGASSNKQRKSPPRDNITSRLHNLNEGFLRSKASEPSRIRLSPRDKNPLESLSKNLLTLRGSVNSSKENLRPTAITTPLSEKNKPGSPLIAKFGNLRSPSLYPDENRHSKDLINKSLTSKTPKVGHDSRQLLSKLFDSIGQNRTPVSKAEKSRAGNRLSDLSQELDKIRYESRKELTSTPVDRLFSHHTIRATTSHTPMGTDRFLTLKYDRTPKAALSENIESSLGSKKKPLADAIPLPKIYELQDALTDINNNDFDHLPASYIEDLVKLSSIIMHRIKGSAYYSKQDRF